VADGHYSQPDSINSKINRLNKPVKACDMKALVSGIQKCPRKACESLKDVVPTGNITPHSIDGPKQNKV
jgi:hypothetical protein